MNQRTKSLLRALNTLGNRPTESRPRPIDSASSAEQALQGDEKQDDQEAKQDQA